MPTFRVNVSEVYAKEFVIRAPDRAAAESFAAAIMSDTPVEPKTLSDRALVTADQKTSDCAITEEPYSVYSNVGATVLRQL